MIRKYYNSIFRLFQGLKELQSFITATKAEVLPPALFCCIGFCLSTAKPLWTRQEFSDDIRVNNLPYYVGIMVCIKGKAAGDSRF